MTGPHRVAAWLRAKASTDLGSTPAGASLPPWFFFTDDRRTPDPRNLIAQLPPDTGVVFRHYNAPDRAALLEDVIQICAGGQNLLMIARGPEQPFAVLAGAVRQSTPRIGIHLPERAIHRAMALKRAAPSRLVSAAAHSWPALRRASLAGVDFVFLSPVFSTKSHPGQPGLGPVRLSRLLSQAQNAGLAIPAFALGGINEFNARRLIGSGLAGLAGIEFFCRWQIRK